jgi:hypothetical protein
MDCLVHEDDSDSKKHQYHNFPKTGQVTRMPASLVVMDGIDADRTT